jgi:hypothetical protein
MSDDGIHQRGKALEDQFFREKDRQLWEKLRNELSATEQRTALAQASGVTDQAVLDQIAGLGVQADTLLCLSMIPLVAMAWADGSLELSERDAVLAAAAESGIAKGSAGHELLSTWLNQQPGPELMSAWRGYVQALKGKLDATSVGQMKATVLHRARQIAEVSGGIFGLGKVAGSERKLLSDLEAEFH